MEMARTSVGVKGTVLAGQGRKYTNTMKQGVHVPDLGAGTCQSISGRKIIDKASNGKAARGVEARAIAAIMCAHCPVLALCQGWIRAAEQPAGSWGGFIAGEGASTRRKRARGTRGDE